MAKQLNVSLGFTADTSQAKAQIQELQATLNQLAYAGNTVTGMNKQTESIKQASVAAKELQMHLNNAFNAQTGRFDLSKLDKSLKISGSNLSELSTKLIGAGQTGQQAFAQLAQSISQANQPTLLLNSRLTEMWTVMKNTMRWQLSSSMIHGFIGGVQQAYGYAKDLNESLNNIRIVTGQSTAQMADFAKEANKAAKALSATTTEYTDAALIYYQQGLTDAEVKERTDATIKLANVTSQSAETVSQQMTAIWNNFDNGSKSLEYYADVITALGAATASSTDEISAGLEKFAGIAETIGLSYEYATASLATITAESREAPETVGTALKTIFARVQGLKMGETLEDGVSLNKYSEALAKVGVDVIDANGQLIEMDNILDKLADKWETLGDAEKTALAQTVAGVRQYTHLMTLMENWDKMEFNLDVAYGSEGSLEEQQKIYEQSWQAAMDRVKAASEGIYDSLLNDEFFIDINNGFANMLGGLESFIDGIGGAKGVILAFSSVLLANFSHKIPQAIGDLKYNINVLTKGAQQAYRDIQQDMDTAALNAFSSGGMKRDSSMGFQIESANKLTAAKTALAAVNSRLTNSERQAYQMSLSMSEALQQEIIHLHQKREALQQNNTELENTAAQQGLETMENRLAAALDKSVDLKLTNLKQKLEQETGAIASVGENLGRQLMEGIKNGSSSIDIGASIQPVTNRIKELVQSFNVSDYTGFINIKKELDVLKNLLPETTSKALGLDEALNKIAGTTRPKKAQAAFLELQKILDNTTISANQARQILSKDFNFKGITQYRTNLKEIDGLNKQIKTSTEQWKQAIESFNPKHTVNKIERISQAAAGLGQIAMTMTSINSLFKTLSNPDLSGWEKLSGSLMAISMIIPGIIGTFRSFNLVLDGALSSLLSQILANKALATVENQRLLEQIQGELLLQAIKNRGSKEDYARLFAKTLIQKRIVVGITEEALAQKILNGEKITATRVTTAKILADFLETKGIQVKTISIWGCVKAMGAYLLATHPLIAATLGLAAAIGIAIAIDKRYLDTQEKAAKRNEEASKTLETLKKNYQEAANAVNSLKQAIEDYDSTQNALSKLTEGSLEWKQALIEANTQVMSLLETYPELAKYISSKGGVLTISAEGWDAILAQQTAEMQNTQTAYMAGMAESAKAKGIEQLTNASIGQSMDGYGEMQSIQIADFGTKMIETLYEEIGSSINTAEEFKQFLQDNGLWEVLGQYSDIDIQAIIDQITTQKLTSSTANESGIIAAQGFEGDYAEAYASTIINSDSYQKNYNDKKSELQKYSDSKLNATYLKELYGEDYSENHRINDEGMEQKKVNGEWQDVGEIAADAIINALAAKYANEETKISSLDEKLLNQNKDYLLGIEGATDGQVNSMLADYAKTGIWDFGQLDFSQIMSESFENALFALGKNGEVKAIRQEAYNQREEKNLSDTEAWVKNTDQREASERQSVLSEAEVDSATFDNYVDSIQKKYQLEEDQLELAEEIAEQNIRNSNAIKKYSDIIEDNSDALSENNKVKDGSIEGSTDYWKAINELKDATKEFTGIDVDTSFIQENLETIQEAAKGSETALIDLQKKAALTVLDISVAPGFKDELAALQEQIGAFDPGDIEIGAALNDAPFYGALQNLLAQGQITAEQANQILSNIGYDPQIDYIEVPMGNAVRSRDGSEYRIEYIDTQGNTQYKTISSDVYNQASQEGMIKIPVINGSKTTFKGSGGASITPAKTSGGGGGGGGSKRESKQADAGERYHTLTRQLEDIKDEYDEISKAADRAFGKDKLNLIDKQTSKLDEQIAKQKELVAAVEEYANGSEEVQSDKSAMEDLFYGWTDDDTGDYHSFWEYLPEDANIPMHIEYDGRGNITNYADIEQAMVDAYNAAKDSDMSDEEFEKFGEKYDEFFEKLDQYEETYDKLKEEEAALQDLINQRIDLQLEKVKYEVELKIDVSEDNLELLDFYLERLSDDAFAVADSLALLGAKFENTYEQFATYEKGLEDVIAQSGLTYEEMGQILNGELDINDYDFTEEQINTIREYKSAMMESVEAMEAIREEAQNKLSEAFDAWNEKLQDSLNIFEHLNSTLQSYKNIIDIVGKKTLGVNKDLMDNLNNTLIKNGINQIDASRRAWEALQSTEETAKKALEEAKASGVKENIEYWEKEVARINEEEEAAQETLLSNWENTLSAIVEQFEKAVEEAVDSFNRSFTGDGTLLSDAFAIREKENERYIKDYEKIYELSKLTRDVNNSIDNSSNLAEKSKLKELLKEINKYEEEGLQMTEYDVEYLQKKYDLYKAQIALEEAQAAKDTVRLQRDSEGGLSYVYTSSNDKITEAQQNYEDALFAMQELNYEYQEELESSIVSTVEEASEALANIKREDFATTEEYMAEINRVSAFYDEQILYYQNQMQSSIDKNKELYEQDWAAYNRITGYKISANENFITSWKDTTLGQLTNSESETVDIYERVVASLDVLIGGLLDAYGTMSQDIDDANKAAGSSTAGFSETAAAEIGKVADESEAAGSAVEDMASQMEDGFESATTALTAWQSRYSDAMKTAVENTMGVVGAYNLLIETLRENKIPEPEVDYGPGSSSSGTYKGGKGDTKAGDGEKDTRLGSTTDSDYFDRQEYDYQQITPYHATAKDNNSFKKKKQYGFDSGGYTGEWGEEGRLAWLHQKEIVLNKEDTSNLLNAVDLVRQLTHTIDLNAQAASLGVGFMQALTLREDKSQTLQQEVTIHAEFPNVQNRSEIEEAFNNLVNVSAQYARRK